MHIRKLKTSDIDQIVQLWYETSVQAHDFIPASYWMQNKTKMASEYLPQSQTYLAIIDDQIAGFVSMIDNYLAAIFIKTEMQRKGIGKRLIDYIKQQRNTIQLKVYRENSNSIDFYKSQGFVFLCESIDQPTGQIECLMEWKK